AGRQHPVRPDGPGIPRQPDRSGTGGRGQRPSRAGVNGAGRLARPKRPARAGGRRRRNDGRRLPLARDRPVVPLEHGRQGSPARRVGGEPRTGFKTVTHAVPMLSIENTYNHDEVREWDARVRRGLNPGEPVRYVVELKVDGVAVSLRYEHGKFVQGATRGDG